jgi:hypothetical protein
MIFFRLFFLGWLALFGLVSWSWLRTQRNRWVRRRLGYFGWIAAGLVMIFLLALLKAVVPK